MEKQIEIWKDIEGFEGLYQVSNLGRVRNVKTNLLKYQRLNHKGYLIVALCKSNINKHYRVHRLVAQAFIPNPDNLPQVNHKNEVKTDNSVENLEWCTNEYNRCYGTRNKRLSEVLTNHPAFSNPVLCIEINKTFPSASEAERWLGIKNAGVLIRNVCKNPARYKTAYGYHWQYAVDQNV